MKEDQKQKEPRYNLEQKQELKKVWIKGIAIIFAFGWIILVISFILSIIAWV